MEIQPIVPPTEPQIHAEQPKNKIRIFILLLILVIAGIVFFIYINPREVPNLITNNIFTSKQASPASAVVPAAIVNPNDKYELSAREQRIALIQNFAKLAFPSISSEIEINKQQTPQELQDLILPGATVIKYNKVVYDNKKTGFIINFSMPASSYKSDFISLNNYSSQLPWSLLDQEQANRFSFTESTNQNENLRIEDSLLMSNQQIIIQTIIN